MRQKSLSRLGVDRHHKQTRREHFLTEMDLVVPWAALSALIEPHYPSGERGRPPIGIELMLRIYFLQQCFNTPDPQAEDSLCPSSNDSRPLCALANGASGPSFYKSAPAAGWKRTLSAMRVGLHLALMVGA
jgi:hypothetical protein